MWEEGRVRVGGCVVEGFLKPDGRLITLSPFYTRERPGKCVCTLGIPKHALLKRNKNAIKAF